MKAIEQAAFADEVTSQNEVMDYRGLSAYLKMAPNTLRHKVMRNEIPFYKIGSSVRFCKKDINEWLVEHKQNKKRNTVGEEIESSVASVVGGEV
jgi:excisionase family DNA binding protein